MSRVLIFIQLALISSCGSKEHSNSYLTSVPNEGFITEQENPSPFYRNIFEKFSDLNLNFVVDLAKLKPLWPVKTHHKKLITRFGTPTTLVIPDWIKINYLHEALDIPQPANRWGSRIRSPVSGIATVILDDDMKSRAYDTAVVIYDHRSHAFVSLLHVDPSDALQNNEFITVKKGEYIGEVADYEPAHIHLSMIDLSNKKIFDPAPYFRNYKDRISPTIKEIYFLDDKASKSEPIANINLDLVLDAFDNDSFSNVNFEVSKIGYNLTNQHGNLLASLEPCNLQIFTGMYEFEETLYYPTTKFLDIGNSFDQLIEDPETGISTDANNPDRSFRYVLSNLGRSHSGDCIALDDDQNFIRLDDIDTQVYLEITVADIHGNTSTADRVFIISKDKRNAIGTTNLVWERDRNAIGTQ